VFLTGTNFPHVLRDNKNNVLHAGLSFVRAEMNRDRIDRSGSEDARPPVKSVAGMRREIPATRVAACAFPNS